jgi:glycogen synthase
MRVLHLIYDHPRNPWVGGGAAIRVREIYERLDGQLDFQLVAGAFPKANTEQDRLPWTFLGRSGSYPMSRLSFGWEASRLLDRGDYDVAVFDFSAYSPVRIPLGRPIGLSLGQIAGPTAMDRWGPLGANLVRRWEAHQLSRVHHVSAVSPWLLQAVRPQLPKDAEGVVVEVGVDEGYFRVQRSESGYILFYGRFDLFQKGIDLLLEAFQGVKRIYPALELKLAGRGRDEGRIRHWIGNSGLSDSIEVISDPPMETTWKLMSGAQMMVMPSRFEGFGMVAAEAMAAGVPLVAAAVDAVPGVVGRDGALLVQGRDVKGLEQGIIALLENPARRAHLSRSARDWARRYRWDRVAEQHLDWLNQIRAGTKAQNRRESV